jgi:ATP-binding cassette subfamily F protein 3
LTAGSAGTANRGRSGEGANAQHATRNTKPQAGTDSKSPLSRQDQKRHEAEQRQARSRGRKTQQPLVHTLEKEIQQLESRQTELVADLEKPETYGSPGRAQQINRELLEVQQRLAELNPEWEQAATKLAKLE